MEIKKNILDLVLISSLSCPASLPGQCRQEPEQKETLPNILFILCDDMGYGDLGCYGQPYIKTPNIDRLASRGMRFTQAYAGSPVSAPSRASLMTGQHTGHTLVRGNKEYWREVPNIRYGVCEEYSVVGQHPYDTAHVILPEVMKSMGYTTGMFGKWAGGYEGSCSTPDKRGIDEYYGYLCQFQAHAYYPNFLNRYSRSSGDTATIRIVFEDNIRYRMEEPEYSLRTQYSADSIHQHALQWLKQQNPDVPFFGLFTYTLPHAELRQPEDSIFLAYKKAFNWDKTWGGDEASRYHESEHVHAHFAAMITRLDTYVGEIMSLLKEMGIDNNTVVVFTSDNGPHEEGGADPEFFGRDGQLRGLKRQCLEGGIRVPFIVNWPEHIPVGVTNDHQLAFYDVMPTLCDLVGRSGEYLSLSRRKGKDEVFDGLSFLPTLMGDSDSQQIHSWLYWEFHETDQIALRMGDWKLVVENGVPKLFNLAEDIHEDHDVAMLYPKQVRKMIDIIMHEHEDNSLFPITLPQK